jgi:AcrR family transcriptional regulator
MDSAEKSTKLRLLEAGEELLAKQGLPGLSMRKLGAMVGLSQAAIYRHFTNKEELLRAILQAGYERLVIALRTVFEDASLSPPQKVSQGFRAYISYVRESPDVYKAVILQDSGPAKDQVHSMQRDISKHRETFSMMVQVLKDGMDQGYFVPANPELTALAIWSALTGLATRFVIERSIEPLLQEQIFDRFCAIILGGLMYEANE